MAATKYLQDYAQQKKSIGDDAIQLKMLDPMIGDLDLRQVHMGSLQPFIAKRKAEGRQDQNFERGARRREVKVPELDTCVFIVPSSLVKNGEERLVVLNRVAKSVVDSMRGLHPTHVFVRVPSKGEPRPIPKMYVTGWKSARERAADKWAERHSEPASEGFRKIRVPDLKHTFGRRLRAAGVSFEDRQDLLGHKSGRITTHYSQAELSNLLVAADKVCDAGESRKSPAVTWLRRRQVR